MEKAFKDWSACMRKAGYKSSSPVWITSNSEWAAPKASSKEIKTAVADVRCKQRLNTVGVWVQVVKEYEEKYIKENPDFYAEQKSQRG
ncbi:hypothetical protein ACWY4P_43040 [Streptomyces sp. LZ34]